MRGAMGGGNPSHCVAVIGGPVDDRQLCIKLTHDVSRLLDSHRAGTVRN
jgi:hypothetical protein